MVLNEGIDRKMFLDANTEHVFVFSKIAEFLLKFRILTKQPDYLINLETLVRSIPDADKRIAHRNRLAQIWLAAVKSSS